MLRHNQKYLETIYKYFAQDINRGDEKYQESPESKNYFRKVEENRNNTVPFDRLQENIATERNANVLVRNIDINYVAQFYFPEKIVPGVFANLRYNDYATYYECLLTDYLY
ncbi:hypothetical protein [Olivibacter domesticus]|uniref:Uncharacterized protein n=1 Tax=Olivibacter domesticus TaxID=407022 RepID=A0A1H7KLL5_OLID1|nr:hypothetical protein [Olivibacter domesticus]SEK87416.1 hypothetical protein SAMN05661044_01389 [Olivibacter domesticus]